MDRCEALNALKDARNVNEVSWVLKEHLTTECQRYNQCAVIDYDQYSKTTFADLYTDKEEAMMAVVEMMNSEENRTIEWYRSGVLWKSLSFLPVLFGLNESINDKECLARYRWKA